MPCFASPLGRDIDSKVLTDKPALYTHALETAKRIAAVSPIAVLGTKACLNHARDHSTQDGLEFAVRDAAKCWTVPM